MTQPAKQQLPPAQQLLAPTARPWAVRLPMGGAQGSTLPAKDSSERWKLPEPHPPPPPQQQLPLDTLDQPPTKQGRPFEGPSQVALARRGQYQQCLDSAAAVGQLPVSSQARALAVRTPPTWRSHPRE